jgi:TatA/E family protein of Tat protein translocase
MLPGPILAFLGGPEIMWICVAVVFIFGAKKLPELARGMGKSLGEFKRGKQEFEDDVADAENDIADSGGSEDASADDSKEN